MGAGQGEREWERGEGRNKWENSGRAKKEKIK